jgi:hypothetical protein
MKVIYTKWHNNYDFVLGEQYEAKHYKLSHYPNICN